ncbi:hypothetical protein M2318_005242 [Metapseudomonas resinovorans]|uniref:hypothetical protein n=1 Tax=Metapseudomonas resinovorans TaxID=53412 RepID=UPI003D22D9FF
MGSPWIIESLSGSADVPSADAVPGNHPIPGTRKPTNQRREASVHAFRKDVQIVSRRTAPEHPDIRLQGVGRDDLVIATVRRNARNTLSSVMEAAVKHGLIARNPVASIARPRVTKKVMDPFTREEAEAVIEHLL